MDKNDYRLLIKKYSTFINMHALLRHLDINHSNYFSFMAGDDTRLSIKKCALIVQALCNSPIGIDEEPE